MRKKFTLGNALLSACCLSSLSLHAQTADRPNIILFLVDDMGWQDTSVPFYNDSVMPLNRRYHTPNMERLAEAGVRFTQAYACPISTPTRCSLMSGMNAARHRVTNWTLDYDKRTDAERGDIVPPEWNYNGIQPDTVTSTHDRKNTTLITGLPEILRRNGYYTIHCGKAHFGAISTTGADPSAFGFEVNIGGGANGAPGSYLGTRNFGQGKWAVKGLEKYHGQDIFLSEAQDESGDPQFSGRSAPVFPAGQASGSSYRDDRLSCRYERTAGHDRPWDLSGAGFAGFTFQRETGIPQFLCPADPDPGPYDHPAWLLPGRISYAQAGCPDRRICADRLKCGNFCPIIRTGLHPCCKRSVPEHSAVHDHTSSHYRTGRLHFVGIMTSEDAGSILL